LRRSAVTNNCACLELSAGVHQLKPAPVVCGHQVLCIGVTEPVFVGHVPRLAHTVHMLSHAVNPVASGPGVQTSVGEIVAGLHDLAPHDAQCPAFGGQIHCTTAAVYVQPHHAVLAS